MENLSSQREVGIEALGLAIPSTYLELSDLAVARGVAPEKFREGLGVLRMAVPGPEEDTVTLAARAAEMALVRGGVSAGDIGLVAVGTETAVDHSKPVASFVQGLLGLPTACRVIELKHACYGGTAALQLAADWIRSGSARGKKALIVCSDIARYGISTPGEPTQGAGAVALVVSDRPALLSLDGPAGVYSEDVHDFWRPLYRKDAVVDGHYSVACYLKALLGAYRAYLDAAGATVPAPSAFSDRFAAIAYHVPYCKMARKAHHALRTLEGDPVPERSFEARVSAGLVMPSLVGNLYTGSLYLAVASALTTHPDDLSGRQLGLFSYGSGLCAEFFSVTVQPGAQERVRALGLLDLLERRRKLSVAEYEEVMRVRDELDTRALVETSEARGGIRYLGTQEHRRCYARAGEDDR